MDMDWSKDGPLKINNHSHLLKTFVVCVFWKIPDKDRFETIILYPDKRIENMEKNHVAGSIYLAAIKRVVPIYICI